VVGLDAAFQNIGMATMSEAAWWDCSARARSKGDQKFPAAKLTTIGATGRVSGPLSSRFAQIRHYAPLWQIPNRIDQISHHMPGDDHCLIGHLALGGWSKKEMKRQAFSSREAVRTFSLEMWARMDSGQLFSVFNEWMKRIEYVIESGGEHSTK
jgi:hypothetical protein